MKTFETFRDIGFFEIDKMTSKQISSFNGNIQVQKYKVTIELIEEPKEVIFERLLKLWKNCKNHHEREPIKNKAKQFGFVLDDELYGVDRK
jgi:hypothetical protein